MKTLLLKKEEVSRLICMKEVIGTVEEAYKAFNGGGGGWGGGGVVGLGALGCGRCLCE